LSERQALESLLAAYLGSIPAQHVLGGEYRRAQANTLSAVIWFCDLRGFTRFVDQSGSQAVLDRLNRYFDLVGTAIQRHHGEILKFVGDAVLAESVMDRTDTGLRW
jgi:adenylate cyclase